MMSRAVSTLVFLSLALLTACDGRRDAQQDGGPGDGSAAADSATALSPFRVVLVDSVLSEDESQLMSRWGYRFAVDGAGRRDTVPLLLASRTPSLLSAEQLTGIVLVDGEPLEGVVYDLRTRGIERIALPDDLTGNSEFSLSPDAAHLLYVARAHGADARGPRAVVRRWPSGEMVLEGAESDGYPSDMIYDVVEWLTPQSFSVRIRLDHFALGMTGDARTEVYQRTTGSLSGGELVTDTVRIDAARTQ